MYLRINSMRQRPTDPENNRNIRRPRPPDGVDDWASRWIKLIPAEALTLYGAGQAVIPTQNPAFLWGLAASCLLLTGIVRVKATESVDHKPQWKAVGITLVSFCLWVASLKPPSGPLDLGQYAFAPGLVALVWSMFLPHFYKGD